MTPMEDGVASAQQWEARGLVFNVRETPRPVRAKRPFSLFPRFVRLTSRRLCAAGERGEAHGQDPGEGDAVDPTRAPRNPAAGRSGAAPLSASACWRAQAWDIEGYKLHNTYERAFEQAAEAAEREGEKKRAKKLRRRLKPLKAQTSPFNV